MTCGSVDKSYRYGTGYFLCGCPDQRACARSDTDYLLEAMCALKGARSQRSEVEDENDDEGRGRLVSGTRDVWNEGQVKYRKSLRLCTRFSDLSPFSSMSSFSQQLLASFPNRPRPSSSFSSSTSDL
jgi:hypothetical protein